ncbi:hypothetical protein Sgly_0824 [Syntrophobotulus glycolicus DSM 8271]|uniref:Uncharacterized protein n=1 Tax=Syntrophobotulus glycolicus (strain DSM 8271 / FlGlyR) TaxID=645991 RepID=F0T1B1_SYNGF|nr:hypothetical protein [Syntrophobotulus glycolicus]ADY55175.1 hypothetical protein Sgly_0824 [Syntrophobotulus glycolicus DSM 8271]
MSSIVIMLSSLILLAIFVGIVFLQKLLTKKHILLGLIFPLISLFNSMIIDIEIISMINNFYSGPRTMEKYQNGTLIQKSTITTNIDIPNTILVLAISNISTIVLFVMFFVDRKKIKRQKELAKMNISDLE